MERRNRRTDWGRQQAASPRAAALVLSCGVAAAALRSVTNAEIFLSIILSRCYVLLNISWAASNPGTSLAGERDWRAPGVACTASPQLSFKTGPRFVGASYNSVCLTNSIDTMFK